MARIGPSQSPRDRILWVLSEKDGKLDRSTLRTMVGMRYALLDPIISELVEEGKIKIEGERIIIASLNRSPVFTCE